MKAVKHGFGIFQDLRKNVGEIAKFGLYSPANDFKYSSVL